MKSNLIDIIFISMFLVKCWKKWACVFLSIALFFYSLYAFSCTSRPGENIFLSPYTNIIKGASDKLLVASGRKIKIEFGKKRMEAVVSIEKQDREAFFNHLSLVILSESGEVITEAAPLEIVEDDLKKINSRRSGVLEVRFRATREDWDIKLKSKKLVDLPNWTNKAKSVLLVSAIGEPTKRTEPKTNGEIVINSKDDKKYLPRESKKQQTFADIVALTERAVFLVYAINTSGRIISQGSGFFINPTGVGVSNNHVFEGGAYWYLRTIDGREYQVDKIIKQSTDHDFVVFTLKQSGIYPFLKIANETPRKGEEIFVLGNPHGLESTVTRGIVSAIRDTLIQIDAAISPGSSGSPVMNLNGEVFGIATLKIKGCENCNMAFDIKVIL